MPGRRGGGGGAAFASDAAESVSSFPGICVRDYAPMPLGSFESTRVVLLPELAGLDCWSPTIVEVDDERLKVLARGARCVSLSSVVG